METKLKNDIISIRLTERNTCTWNLYTTVRVFGAVSMSSARRELRKRFIRTRLRYFRLRGILDEEEEEEEKAC